MLCRYCDKEHIKDPCEECIATFSQVDFIKCRLCGDIVEVNRDESVLLTSIACGNCQNEKWILMIDRGGIDI